MRVDLERSTHFNSGAEICTVHHSPTLSFCATPHFWLYLPNAEMTLDLEANEVEVKVLTSLASVIETTAHRRHFCHLFASTQLLPVQKCSNSVAYPSFASSRRYGITSRTPHGGRLTNVDSRVRTFPLLVPTKTREASFKALPRAEQVMWS